MHVLIYAIDTHTHGVWQRTQLLLVSHCARVRKRTSSIPTVNGLNHSHMDTTQLKHTGFFCLCFCFIFFSSLFLFQLVSCFNVVCLKRLASYLCAYVSVCERTNAICMYKWSVCLWRRVQHCAAVIVDTFSVCVVCVLNYVIHQRISLKRKLKYENATTTVYKTVG